MKWLNKLGKYRQVVLYLFFGGATTLVNFVIYVITSFGLGLSAWLSAAIAWVFAVCFAFVTNKIIVFKSKAEKANAIRELGLFITARVTSGAISAAGMLVFVDILAFNEIIIFTLCQIFVIAFNYAASKWLIFKINGGTNNGQN